MGQRSSGVGVLDKSVLVLDAVGAGPASLAALVERTGLSRATAHRLALALEVHGLVTRDPDGRFVLGPRLAVLAASSGADPLARAAVPVLERLRDDTGESAQLYVRRGTERVCTASADRGTGLRDTVPVGAVLPLTAGSAAQVLLAWEPPDAVAALLDDAAFSARTLADVRRRGWASSAAEREPGLGSASAPVRLGERVVAAVSVSGPLDRLGRQPGPGQAPALLRAAADLAAALA